MHIENYFSTHFICVIKSLSWIGAEWGALMWTSICFCAAVKTGDFAVDEYKSDSTRGFGGFRDSVILE